MKPVVLPRWNSIPHIVVLCLLVGGMWMNSLLRQAPFVGNTVLPESPALETLPLAFVPNHGQFADKVLWQTRGAGATLSFQSEGIDVQFADTATVRLRWEGAMPSAVVTGGEPLDSVVNYVRGNDPSQWQTGIPAHATVMYTNLYPGIHLHYDGKGGVLKGTYTVAAGVDPAQIRWNFEGVAHTQVEANTGNLRMTLPNGRTFVEEAPIAWQVIDGIEVAVPVEYVVTNHVVSFAFPTGYNLAHPLVIDPTLVYSSYFGEISTDTIHDIKVDGSGNVYVTGQTYSDNLGGLPNTTTGQDDAFVAKLNAAGTAWQWITYLGGTESEAGYGVAVSTQGDVWMTGYTDSDDFPTTANAYQADFGGFWDAMVVRLNGANGTVNYSTYFGYDNLDEGRDIALDGNGNAYVTGQLHQQNVMALKLTGGATPSFVYGVQWGDDRGKDMGYGIAVDSAGRAYITGMTENAADPWGSTFPIVNALQPTCGLYNSTPDNCTQDAFVSILNAAGNSLEYSTLLGGGGSNGQTSGSDTAYDIALDGAGNIYVAGTTYAYDFPTANAAYPNYPDDPQFSDAWVSKISANGQTMLYSTYLGGEGSEEAQALAVDSSGNAFVFGFTRSNDFPTLNPIQGTLGTGGTCYSGSSVRRCYDAFLTKFNTNGQVGWSSYFGGDYDEYGYGIARDGSGNLPQTEWAGNEDGFVAKISEQNTPPPATVTPTQTGNPPTVTATATQPGNPPTPTPTRTPIPNAKKMFLPLVFK
jgi:hypothetical protein